MDRRRWVIIAVLAITLAGLALRAWPIASRPLWFDEASDTLTSAKSAGVEYRQFFLWTNDFQAAPFTFLLRRVSMDLLGTEAAWAQRLPALLCAVACIPLAFFLGRMMLPSGGAALGLLLAAMLAFDPSTVDLGQQARSYPMLMLLALAAMLWAIYLFRDPERNLLHWVGLGIVLGLAFCTTQFALALWVGIALAAGVILVGGKLAGQPHPKPGRLIAGLFAAFLLALVISAVGLYNLFSRDAQRNWGAAMTYPKIAKEIIVNAKDLFGLTPAGLLLYPLAATGLYLLFRKCKTSAVVVACVAVAMVMLLFPFRRTHHFMAPRYLSLMQPAVWTGLAMLALGFEKRWLRGAGAAIVGVVLVAGLYHSIDQESWFTGPDSGKWLTTPQIIRLRDTLVRPGDAVVYQPVVLATVGHVYHLDIDSALGASLYENYQDRPDPKVPPQFWGRTVWLVVGMVGDSTREEKARKLVKVLAESYGVPVDVKTLQQHIREHRVALVRFDRHGIHWESIGPRDKEVLESNTPGVDWNMIYSAPRPRVPANPTSLPSR